MNISQTLSHNLDDDAATSRDSGRGQVQKRRRPSPNFRDFPKDENPLAPRYFSVQSSPLSPTSESAPAPTRTVILGPTGEPITYDEAAVTMSQEPDWHPRSPAHLSEAVADAFADTTDSVALVPMKNQDEESVSNFSQSGIVHLGPISSEETSPAIRSQSIGSSSRSKARSGLEGMQGAASPLQHGSGMMQTLDQPSAAGSRSGPPSSSVSSSEQMSAPATVSSSDMPQITFRYQHMEDDNGHHLIVGREGTLTQCEDEVCLRYFHLPT